MKKALVLGVTGQDGSYLADLLLEKGYLVHGMVRRSSSDPKNLWRVSHLLRPSPESAEHLPSCSTQYRGCDPSCPKDWAERFAIHRADFQDPASVRRVLEDVCPDEIYNEADQDHVGWSHDTPGYSADVTYGAVLRTLEDVRRLRDQGALPAGVKFFQPLSATMFGNASAPQNEGTPFAPTSPYAISKVAAYYACRYYRREHGLFVSTAIFYNHDSIRRRGDYLLQHLAHSAVAIKRNEAKAIRLGNSMARVEVGCAMEYMEAAWKILQLSKSDDFVLGTGKEYNVLELAGVALMTAGLGTAGEDIRQLANRYVLADRNLQRVGDTPSLVANCYKAKAAFDWDPVEDACTMVQRLTHYYLDNPRGI